MAALIRQQDRIGFKVTGVRASVPDNSIAKLMYYLHCILSCVPNARSDGPIVKLTDYKNYHRLSYSEKQKVVELALVLSPHPACMGSKIIVPVEDNHKLLGELSNKFIELSNTRNLSMIGIDPSAARDRAIVIQGERTQVLQLMIATEGWLRNNFLTPFESEKWRLPTPSRSSSRSNRSGCELM